jgi:RNA-directed DNA polymerase
MSPESSTTGDKPNPSPLGEGRQEQAGQQPARAQRSGGDYVDRASGSPIKVSWENSGNGNTTSRSSVQAGNARKANDVDGEVGVPHSSVDLHYFKRCGEPRGDTCSMRGGEAKDAGMAGAIRIISSDKVRQLQIALYRKAKAEPKYRFWSLYGDMQRRDVLEAALTAQRQNNGASGVDGETLAAITATPQTRRQWLDRLQAELKTKTCRASSVRRVMIPKSGGGERPLGIPTVKDRVVQMAV